MFEFKSILDYLNEVLFNLFHLGHNNKIRGAVLINQVYFTAIQSMYYVFLISSITSIVVVIGFLTFMKGTGIIWLYEILIFFLMRDFAPLAIASILLLRSGTAVSSEIAAMKTQREISMLLSIGVSPISYLVTPRIVGMILSSLLMAIIFGGVGIGVGCITAQFHSSIPYSDFINDFSTQLSFFDYVCMTLKNSLSAFFIASICCFQGLQCKETITDIPQRNILAVTETIAVVFTINSLFLVLELINSDFIGYLKYA